MGPDLPADIVRRCRAAWAQATHALRGAALRAGWTAPQLSQVSSGAGPAALAAQDVHSGASGGVRALGHAEAKARIRDVLSAVVQSELDRTGQTEGPGEPGSTSQLLHANPPSGILLYGPTGCGKTTLARAIVAESTLTKFTVDPPELFSLYLGETEEKIRALFASARRSRPCVILIDEVDAIAPRRGSKSLGTTGVESRALSQLLNELDGIQGASGVCVIGVCVSRTLESTLPALAGSCSNWRGVDTTTMSGRLH